jgi:long-subunit acyl-CoA synthetase (AMP-forming)
MLHPRDIPSGSMPPSTNDFKVIRPTSSTDLIMLLYTSGSTGRPKGAMISDQLWFNECKAFTVDWYAFIQPHSLNSRDCLD